MNNQNTLPGMVANSIPSPFENSNGFLFFISYLYYYAHNLFFILIINYIILLLIIGITPGEQ